MKLPIFTGRTIVRVVVLCAAFAALIPVVLFQFVFPAMLVRPYRIHWNRTASPTSPVENPAKYGLRFDELDATTGDGIQLRGWFIHAGTDKPAGTVILLHGWDGCKQFMIPVARLMAVHGFNAILYDSRACGESGGKYCTYGFKEKYDPGRFIDAAQKRYGDLGPVAIIGVSLGGAVATQTMAVEKRFKCGVIISSFGSLEEAARAKFQSIVHCRLEPVFQHALRVAEHSAGFRVTDINPIEDAKRITQPVLVIHGENDPFFPVQDGRRIFENINSTKKEWYVAKNSDHDHILQFGDVVNVNREILTFLAEQMQRDTDGGNPRDGNAGAVQDRK